MRLALPVRRVLVPLVAALLLLGAAVAATPAGAASASAGRPDIVNVPVSFRVQNFNRSDVPCRSDGRTYTVRGNLVAPRSVLQTPRAGRAVTLYLHGLSFGKFFWDFRAVKGYDYARKLARRGQASLIVDRLGYGASGKPNGYRICAGSRADIAHQMVEDLRAGRYRAPGSAPRFGTVFLAGHSFGGQIAEIEAYSFGDIDGLAVISYTDVGQTALTRKSGAYAERVCAAGGKRVTPGGPRGYSSFGPPSGAPAALFHDVSPRVLDAAKPKLSIDPCGDGASFARATKVDLRHVRSIRVPVLLIQGGADKLFDAHKQRQQANLFGCGSHVSRVIIANTAHAVTLERTRNQFAAAMASHLEAFEHRT